MTSWSSAFKNKNFEPVHIQNFDIGSKFKIMNYELEVVRFEMFELNFLLALIKCKLS